MANQPLVRLGALGLWHSELRAARRGEPERSATWPADTLWRAATCEKAALELAQSGDKAGAQAWMDIGLSRLCGVGYPGDRGETAAELRKIRQAGGKLSLSGPYAALARAYAAARFGKVERQRQAGPWGHLQPAKLPAWSAP